MELKIKKTMKKIALITGITGQDGSYLAEFLLKKNYIVHGVKRRSSILKTDRVDHIYSDPHNEHVNFFLHYGDLSDSSNIIRIIQETQPDEIYNLAAMSHVRVSFDIPEYVGNVDALGTLRILEAVRLLGLEKKTKIYQASTSELYGKVQEIPQKETTPFYPRSPYGVAKLYAFWISKNYREAYGLKVSNGILFNHESPRRGENFVTRKITMTISKIVYGIEKYLFLGNLNAKRDWGHAKDFVEAMWLILQSDTSDDYVIATGNICSVREFLIKAFNFIGITLSFSGEGVDEVGFISKINSEKFCKVTSLDFCNLKINQELVKIDQYYFRPTEVDLLQGDSSKAQKELGWKPKYNIENLVSEMMENDLSLMSKL